jgi:hypothetical protein
MIFIVHQADIRVTDQCQVYDMPVRNGRAGISVLSNLPLASFSTSFALVQFGCQQPSLYLPPSVPTRAPQVLTHLEYVQRSIGRV